MCATLAAMPKKIASRHFLVKEDLDIEKIDRSRRSERVFSLPSGPAFFLPVFYKFKLHDWMLMDAQLIDFPAE